MSVNLNIPKKKNGSLEDVLPGSFRPKFNVVQLSQSKNEDVYLG